MRLARTVLVLCSAAWAGFGVMLLVWPHRLDGVGLQVDTALARIEVRGFYGGLELGIAAFLAWSALRTARLRSALVLAALTLGGTALGRLVGIALEGGSTTAQMWTFATMELVGAALASTALVRLGRDAPDPQGP